jgi:Flp pilus assembly protein TadD
MAPRSVPRPKCRPGRLASLLAGSASLAGLTMLGACAGVGGPPEPLVAGGRLAEGLAALAPGEPLSAELWLAPTRGPAAAPEEAPNAPLPALRPALTAPRPPPRKPAFEPRVVWLPQLKPAAPDGPRLAASAPTVWPAPPKPAGGRFRQAIEPAAGAQGDPVAAPVSIERRRAGRPLQAGAVSVVEPDALLPQLDRAARAALLAGDPTTALQLYQRTAELFPSERGPLLGRALALQQLGRESEAQALYQVLLDEDASDLAARIALLGVLAQRAPDEALRLLRRLARHHPDDARVPAQIAMALARKADLGAALVEQRRAVALAPTNLGYLVNLAILHDRAGHEGEAALAYRRALDLATLTGAPSAQLGQVAVRLQHLRELRRPRQVAARAPR